MGDEVNDFLVQHYVIKELEKKGWVISFGTKIITATPSDEMKSQYDLTDNDGIFADGVFKLGAIINGIEIGMRWERERKK